MEKKVEQIKKKLDFGGPLIRSEKPQINNPFRRKEKEENISASETEEERKARLEYDRRLRARAVAKIAMGEHNLSREEKGALKKEPGKSRLSQLRSLQRDKKLIKQEGKKVAKEKVKKEVKKKIKKAVGKRVLVILGQTAPVWAPILGVLIMCLFGFLALMYYTCEGGGLMAWLLRKTALGGLCSM